MLHRGSYMKVVQKIPIMALLYQLRTRISETAEGFMKKCHKKHAVCLACCMLWLNELFMT